MKTLNGKKQLTNFRLEVADLQKTKAVASEAYSNLQTCVTREADLKARIS